MNFFIFLQGDVCIFILFIYLFLILFLTAQFLDSNATLFIVRKSLYSTTQYEEDSDSPNTNMYLFAEFVTSPQCS